MRRCLGNVLFVGLTGGLLASLAQDLFQRDGGYGPIGRDIHPEAHRAARLSALRERLVEVLTKRLHLPFRHRFDLRLQDGEAP